ncbi:Inner membrane ABC transporter permease protein YcjP [Caloramator mitchellensis]|uniref:Inner membrane ABC transporter permease protein YcjP n=1 Tax=Caloramator mitchellensis TaxID=908809 RepID=A0A0R3JVN4_CALMK|nr:carbohydrate ABC transporter permease [Caloramator mitchellensis]KRQ87616.1 Inner membrane ABC transporter permease protein YcjP [Caloramator mitchellensis]
MKKKLLINIFLNILVIIVLLITLMPFYFMVTTALKTSAASVAYPPEIIPKEITFQHFRDIFNPKLFPFLRYFSNSFKIAFSTASLAVIVGSMGAYSLARLDFPGKKYIQESTLVVYMFSGILLVVPLFRIISKLGLYNNKLAVIITCLVTTLPATLFMLSSYFKSIPDSLEEAAMIDGLSRFQVIYKIVIPLSIPAIVSVFAYVFMIAWNDFLFSSIFLSTPDNMTLSIGLRQLFSSKDYVWGRMMAASFLTAVPVIIIFSLVERFITGGLVAGGVKE